MNPLNNFNKPPLDFSLTFLEIIDYNIRNSPDHPVFQHLNPDGSIRSVTWKDAGNAFYNAARIIQEKVRVESSQGPTVIGILANIDFSSYIALIIGAMLAGFVPFPISNRNSPAAVAHLLREGDCKALFVSQDLVTQTQVEKAFKALDNDGIIVRSLSVPTYEDLYVNDASARTEVPPFLKLREIMHDSLCIIIHSSGSVSFPKPVNLSYRYLLQQGLLISKGELEVCGEIFGAHGIPLYHVFGIFLITCCVTLGMTLSVLSPKEKSVLSPDLILSIAVRTNCTCIACVPAFIENWAKEKRNIAIMKRFKALLYGGASLSSTVGDMLVREGINIVPMYGSTEAGVLSLTIQRRTPPEGWDWLRTAPGVDLAFIPSHIGEHQVYRIVVKSGTVKTLAKTNTTIDGIPAYDTNDLVVRHPNNPLLWKIFGRDDDQIMHSTGEKTNPTPIEGRLIKDPRISSAVMFGRSKFQPGVLIQPSPGHEFDPTNDSKLEEYRNSIWETVEEANKDSPQHSRIFKEFILVTDPSKPFELTAKGTPRRNAVLKAYSPEIQNLYQALEGYTLSKVPAPASWDLVELRTFLRTIVTSVLGHDIKEKENIFDAGGDSLAALSIRNSIMHALRRSKLVSNSHLRAIPSDFTYMFPSVDALGGYIYGILSLKSLSPDDNSSNLPETDVENDIVLPLLRAFRGPTVVKLREGHPGETPLILIHGAGGSISDFIATSEIYPSALWAIQVTEETPFTSIQALAEFYYEKIKKEQSAGPYRLASYSGSSLLLLYLVQLFDSQGDHVAQFDFLDHFPTLFLEEIATTNLDPPSIQATIEDSGRSGVESICRLVRDSSSGADRAFRQKFASEMLSALNGESTNELAVLVTQTIRSLVKISLEFLLGDLFHSTDGAGKKYLSREKILEWMRKVKKPPTIYVAKDGIAPIFGSEDLGARAAFQNAQVVGIDGNHFTFLVNHELIRRLQDY